MMWFILLQILGVIVTICGWCKKEKTFEEIQEECKIREYMDNAAFFD